MGIEIQSWAWKQKLNPATKLVFIKLAESANDETGECWPSLRHLGNRCDMAPNTVRFHIRKLKEAGLVSVEAKHRADGTQTSNTYRILTSTCQEVDTYPAMDGRGTLQPIAPLEPELEPSGNVEHKEHVLHSTCGEFHNVTLSSDEEQKLTEKFGDAGMRDRIENLSEYKASKGVKYKSDYATILTWDRKNGHRGNGNGKLQSKFESKAESIIRKNHEASETVLAAIDRAARRGDGGGDPAAEIRVLRQGSFEPE